MIAWDNLPRGASISCPVIEKTLTSPTITDRVLGVSEQTTVRATTIQYFTGNNISPVGDMASRSYNIRIDVDRPDPENRTFQHPDPFAWTLANRSRILRALYTLLVWNPVLKLDVAARPRAKTRFKKWWTLCATPVWLLTSIDFAAILRARESEDTEVSGLSVLLRGLWGTYGGNQFTADELAHLAVNLSGSPTQAAWALPVQAALEEATGKPFPPNIPLDARKVGKRLQMVVGRPVQVDSNVLTLARTANAKAGNRYHVTATP